MALSGVQNKFPNGIETKPQPGSAINITYAVNLLREKEALEKEVEDAALFVKELKAENERLNDQLEKSSEHTSRRKSK